MRKDFGVTEPEVPKAQVSEVQMSEMVLSSSAQDYLKAIYELGETEVKTQALADALSVSPASVTGMIKKLSGLNLISYERYQGVDLTAAGRKIALETLRHHRLIETYLAEALGYAWHEVHDEAERLEHVISEDFEERIALALGNPAYDPHGDPIPGRDGSLPQSLGRPLTELGIGQHATITRITNQNREVLEYLAAHHLVPGETVTVEEHAPFSGPVTLSRQRDTTSTIALSAELAAAIHAQAAHTEASEAVSSNP